MDKIDDYDYDLLIVGGGPAGQNAAWQAALLRKRVAIIDDRDAVGGVCVFDGTIPSKSFREAVLFLSGFRQRGVYGASYRTKTDITMEDLTSRCQYIIRTEVENIKTKMVGYHVEHIVGRAELVGSNEVRVKTKNGNQRVTTRFLYLAPGARPFRVGGIDFNGKTIFDSDDILSVPTLPHSLTVVGAGVIGLEYASMFAALGTHVTVIDGRRRILDFVDRELVEALLFRLRDLGVTFRLGEVVESCQDSPSGQVVTTLLSKKVVVSETVLFSAGRVSSTEGLGLENVGITPADRGRIIVNDFFQTSQPNIYAGGDVIGFPALASTSAEQGRLAAQHMFQLPLEQKLGELLPYGIYSIPEIAFVGKTEEELTAIRTPYEVGIARFGETTKGHLVGDDDGLLKLIFHRESRELLGVHIIGHGASELVHLGQAVLSYGGTIDYFLTSVFNYPTLTGCYKSAALNGWNKLF